MYTPTPTPSFCAQFTCFTSTTVQIRTQKLEDQVLFGILMLKPQIILNIVALLVQKYKY